MVGRGELTDKAWAQLAPLLPRNQRRGGRWRDHRTVLNGILWKLRIFVGALPAQAAVLRNVYYGADDCYRYGAYGVENGLWPSYTCTFVGNGSSTPPYGYWFLYT
jgi:Putative transposase of IS4/5 family (DUF4096)